MWKRGLLRKRPVAFQLIVRSWQDYLQCSGFDAPCISVGTCWFTECFHFYLFKKKKKVIVDHADFELERNSLQYV